MSTETKRRAVVQRAVPNAPKTTNNNTINLQSDITLYFVWYPGARDLAASLITLAPKQSIPYVWQRKGMSPVKGNLTTGELTLNLPPRSEGILTIFESQWYVGSVPGDMGPPYDMGAVQRRLNSLGYSLRSSPGLEAPGISAEYSKEAESAVLSFQVDYQRPAAAPVDAPVGPLHVRGEWEPNVDSQKILDSQNVAKGKTTPALGPSFTDSIELQKALRAVVGK